MIYLDTHIVIWLYGGCLENFSRQALSYIENEDLFISPMVNLELQYLKETQRIVKTPEVILKALTQELNLKVCQKDFTNVVRESLRLSWTRDPFDRLIVAQASLNDDSLLTKDRIIKKNYKKSIWS